MAGKEKKVQYHYDTKENDFKFLGTFESQTDVFNMYFNGKKGKLYNTYSPYRKLPDNTYVTYKRIGRDGLRIAYRLCEDPNVYKTKSDKPIAIYNSLGENVGNIKNIRVLKSILNSCYNASNKVTNKANKSKFGKVTFKYK